MKSSAGVISVLFDVEEFDSRKEMDSFHIASASPSVLLSFILLYTYLY
jgi:hypothetical protein